MSRRNRLVQLGAIGVLVAGCYSLQPARGTTPAVGTKVAFDVNDAGRVALGGLMAPEIAQIEGQLTERSNDEYVVAVSAVRTMRGGEQVWSGEKVRIKSEYVSSAYVRQLSRSRTIVASAVGVGAVAFFVTRSILGGGDTENPKPPDDTAHTRRLRP